MRDLNKEEQELFWNNAGSFDSQDGMTKGRIDVSTLCFEISINNKEIASLSQEDIKKLIIALVSAQNIILQDKNNTIKDLLKK